MAEMGSISDEWQEGGGTGEAWPLQLLSEACCYLMLIDYSLVLVCPLLQA